MVRRLSSDDPLAQRAGLVRILQLLLYILVALATALVMFTILARQNRNQAEQQQIQRVQQVLLQCTTPGRGHVCYERGQQNTREAIQQLERIIIAANACSGDKKNITPAAVKVCVDQAIVRLSKPSSG